MSTKLKLLEIAKKRSPEILTGLGIAGMISATVLAVKSTPKALILIEERKREVKNDILTEDHEGNEVIGGITLKPVEIVKITWKLYLPTLLTSGMSIACIIAGQSIKTKRNATLATAYALSESAAREYQKKVVEVIGDKKEKAVRDEIAKDRLQKKSVVDSDIIVTNRGQTLCFDSLSGRYFKSDIELIRKAENRVNKEIIQNMYVSLNDFYTEIGLPDIVLGDELGWNVERLMELDFSSQLTTNGTPCLVINYSVTPRYDYDSLL